MIGTRRDFGKIALAAIPLARAWAAIHSNFGGVQNYDPVAYFKEHHARITNLHLKDRKKDHGPNVPWGEGDTPIKEVLLLLTKEKYAFPANIEYEYGRQGMDTIAEMSRCVQYCKDVLQ